VQSCWSEPIFASDGTVLGTFAIYHAKTQLPTKEDKLLIEHSANLASIAIEKSMAATKLKESEELYRRLTEEVTDVIWRTDKDLFITYISPSDEKFRGYKANEVIGRHVFEMFTPEGSCEVEARFPAGGRSSRGVRPATLLWKGVCDACAYRPYAAPSAFVVLCAGVRLLSVLRPLIPLSASSAKKMRMTVKTTCCSVHDLLSKPDVRVNHRIVADMCQQSKKIVSFFYRACNLRRCAPESIFRRQLPVRKQKD